MKIGQTLRRLVELKSQVDNLEQEAEPLPRSLLLKPGDEVPEDVSSYDRVISVVREPEVERDLTGCDDVLTVTVKQPRRPLIITRGGGDGIPRTEHLEPEGFSE